MRLRYFNIPTIVLGENDEILQMSLFHTFLTFDATRVF